MNKISKYL